MYYAIIDENQNTVSTHYDRFEAGDEFDRIGGFDKGFILIKVIPCNSCGSEYATPRSDYYGIPTGHYCQSCYDDPTKYKYRKDRYPTIEHDGFGERLGLDEDW